MIPAARAFAVAHEAISGKRCHDEPCSVTIERDEATYTVTFARPAGSAPGAEPTRVMVDAESGELRGTRNAAERDRESGAPPFISAKRALEIGIADLRESMVTYDPNWTTTIELRGDRYVVTFPLPAAARAENADAGDFALQVSVDARSGAVLDSVRSP